MENFGVKIFLKRISQTTEDINFFTKERNLDVFSSKSEKVKMEKISAWRLLLYSARNLFGLDEESCGFEKLPSGKWTSKKFCFSISHTKDFVCVAISKDAVGVDVENYDAFSEKRSLDDVEKLGEKLGLKKDLSHFSVLRSWVKKEAKFKRIGLGSFIPSKIGEERVESFALKLFGDEVFLAVDGEPPLEIYLVADGFLSLEKIPLEDFVI